MFCKESLRKINAKYLELFRRGSVHKFCCLKVLITLEQLNELLISGRKKKNLNEQNFDGEANWSGIVNFHCMQIGLVMSMWFIFGDE